MDAPRPLRRFVNAVVLNFLRLWGLKVSGLENVPKSGPLIVASNHVSNLDGFLLCVAMSLADRWPRFMGKQEIFKAPLLGRFMLAMGHFPVDRSRGDIGALRLAASILKEGHCLGVFPQGTRGGKGAKAGVGFLARLGGAPVVPLHLIGTDKWPLSRLEVRVGPPLRFDAKSDAQAFADTVMETVYRL